MHLLSAQAGALQNEGEAIDLGQSPAPLLFLSAADSEMSLLAAAMDAAGVTDVRLANVLRLAHNLSVDLWLEKTVAGSALVVVRLLGGSAYWSYGVGELEALAANGAIRLCLLPGDATPDPALKARSTIGSENWDALFALFAAGGPDNLAAALAEMQALAANPAHSIAAHPRDFARFGHWWPADGVVAPEQVTRRIDPQRPIAPILFYRALLEGGGTGPLARLVRGLERAGMQALPLFAHSFKSRDAAHFVQAALAASPPDAILNLTGFALGIDGLDADDNPFAGCDAPVIQLIQGGRAEALWSPDAQGLSPKDLAMQVVMPELDGRHGMILIAHKEEARWHAPSQCALATHVADGDGIARAVALAANWSQLRRAEPADRRVGLVLANYPIRDGRLANGVGYDAPQSSLEILTALKAAGYATGPLPASGNALIERLQSGPTNADPARGQGDAVLPLAEYLALFDELPHALRGAVQTRWGAPEDDPFCRADGFHLPVVRYGHVAVLLQPARGYERDETASYHDPDLVPPHAYLAAYLWLRRGFGAHALLHNGKHGTLEWLPGKAVALGAESWPLALWGALPHLYPFIVNDPGEGTQAKRRTGAVIIDHLTPPLTRAETYGPLKDLEALLDEYYAATGMDRRRLGDLRRRILGFARDARLERDVALPEDEDEALISLDNFLCDLKESQIRDGLHIFGQSPKGRLETDLLVAFARVPRGTGELGDLSLIRALSDDLGLGFDPLTAKLGAPWTGPRPDALARILDTLWRSVGDTVERLEALAAALVAGEAEAGDWPLTRAVLARVQTVIRPKLAASGPNEIKALLDGLDGRFIAPGPSGAPTRGRLDVLPTGRNFYSLDNRALPTPTAWALGQASADSLLTRHFQAQGAPLMSAALSVWGTANMRTGGDDIAQALALIGAKPVWDPSSLRVSGYEIVTLAKLGRPRVDVTLRISGFFRDAFPMQIALFDKAIRAIGALDEPAEFNPIADRMRREALDLMAAGASESEAALRAGHRIFGSKPGAYGAGLQGLIDSGQWGGTGDLAEAFLNWGQYAYGANAAGAPERDLFSARLASIEAVLHNQDNREHDLLDSDDYYQFEGGLAAAAMHLQGQRPAVYHSDHARPDRVVTRTLEEEISKVMRSRVVNPKWLEGVMRHGYKGAFEIVATLDYMFAFAVTTGAVKSHHFDLAFTAFVEDDRVRDFLRSNNPHGFEELRKKFAEARARMVWTPLSNSAHAFLDEGPNV